MPGRRWLHLSQPISDEPLGLGFPHRAGRYQPGRPPFPSSVCFRCVEAFRILIWHLILPGFRWLYEPPPISHRPVGLGFPRCVAAIDPGDHRFRLHLVGFVDAWKDFGSRDGKQSSAGASELLESHHSWIVQLIRGFHAVWGGINPEDGFFFFGMLKFYMCGSISDPGMAPDLPRVALARRGPANPRCANGVGVSIPC